MLRTTIETDIVEQSKKWADEFGEEFLVELIDTYLADSPERLIQMRQALERDDFQTLIREAHTLTSSSANVGAMRLSSIAKGMEAAGYGGRIEEIVEAARKMEEEFVQVKSALEIVRATPSSIYQSQQLGTASPLKNGG